MQELRCPQEAPCQGTALSGIGSTALHQSNFSIMASQAESLRLLSLRSHMEFKSFSEAKRCDLPRDSPLTPS